MSSILLIPAVSGTSRSQKCKTDDDEKFWPLIEDHYNM